MNVSLPKHLSRYVAGKIAGGRYGSASEVIREALRAMEERETFEESPDLQAKITAGLRTPLRPVTEASWRRKWKKGMGLADRLRKQRRQAA